MDIVPESFSVIIIVLGLAIDVIGASLMVKASDKTWKFISTQMNRTVGDDFESKMDKVSKAERNYTTWGWLLLFTGFVIQAIGYSIPFIFKGLYP